MPIEWCEARFRRWGTAEVPAFGPALPGGTVQPLPAWLEALVGVLHDAPQGSAPVAFALRRGELAFALRVAEGAQDGTGRIEQATHVRWLRADSPTAGSDRLCQVVLAWLLRERELLLNDDDPQGRLAACATAEAVEAARVECVPAGLDWLLRLSTDEPVRAVLPAEGDTAARVGFVLRLRAALHLGGERLEPVVVSGLATPPPFSPPVLWLTAGPDGALDARASALAERVARLWTRPLRELSSEVAGSPEPPVVALQQALALASVLGPAVAQAGGAWRFDPRAADHALSAQPEAARAGVRRATAQHLRQRIAAVASGRWRFEAGLGLVLGTAAGRVELIVRKGEERDGLESLERWLGSFDADQLQALFVEAPTAALAGRLPPALLEWPPRLLAWAAQHQSGEIHARWRGVAGREARERTARHVTTGAAEYLDCLPLGLLVAARAVPAESARLGRLLELVGAETPLAGQAPAEIGPRDVLGLARTALARCGARERPGWIAYFASMARGLEDAVPLEPALAGELYEALPPSEREAALIPLLRCAPGQAALARDAVAAFLRGGAARPRWESVLPDPSPEMVVEVLRRPPLPPPTGSAPARDPRARFWTYVGLRTQTRSSITAEQVRELIRASDGSLWRSATCWPLADSRDRVLFDLWLYAPAGTLGDVTAPPAMAPLIQEAVSRGASPRDHGHAWDEAAATVRLFLAGRAWADELRQDPKSALSRLASDPGTQRAAREVGWDLHLRRGAGGLGPVWRVCGGDPERVRALLESLPWPGRLELAEASEGQVGLAEILSVTES